MVHKSLLLAGTSLKLKKHDPKINDHIGALQTEGINLRDDDSMYTLENMPNYFIFENEFVNLCRNLLSILRKYNEKKYDNTIKIYCPENRSFIHVQAKAHDLKKYKKLITNNIIDGDIREFCISINVLNEILDNSDNSRLFLDMLILFALASKNIYNAESLKSEFRIEDSNYKIELDIRNPTPINLYPLYDWIINDEEYEESYKVKLHIIRQVIVNRKDIYDVEGILEDGKLAYKRIISRKTNDYFEQLNQLKDDFLILSRNENNALRTLHLTFFAWIGYLGVELFNIIAKYNGDNIISYLLCSKGTKKGIIVLMFMIAFVFIFISYVSEINSHKSTYDGIKAIYKDKILFETDTNDENKFEKVIKRPQIGIGQIVIFLIIISTLLARFCIAII